MRQMYKVKKAPCITTVRILLMRLENPKLTLRAIGNEVGKTGEGVRQVLRAYRLPTRHIREVLSCPECGGKKDSRLTYCSKCFYERHHVSLVCTACGVTFERAKSDYKRNTLYTRNPKYPQYSGKRFFCNKKCSGRWFGKTYGGGRKEATSVS